MSHPETTPCVVCGLPMSRDYCCKKCDASIHWFVSMDHDDLKTEGRHGAHCWCPSKAVQCSPEIDTGNHINMEFPNVTLLPPFELAP